MNDGDAVLLGHHQPDLNERVSLPLFFVMPIPAEFTLPAVEIRVGYIVDDTFRSDSKIFRVLGKICGLKL